MVVKHRKMTSQYFKLYINVPKLKSQLHAVKFLHAFGFIKVKNITLWSIACNPWLRGWGWEWGPGLICRVDNLLV